MPIPSALRRARVSTAGFFFITGFSLALWVVNIPAVQSSLEISHSILGTLLLFLGLGSFLGMQATGWLTDRIGSRRATIATALFMVASVNLLGLATEPWHLGAALLIFGLGFGGLDVAMNDQAVLVERGYDKPIMSAFHAIFSIGGAVGALVGAGLQGLNLSAQWAFGVAAVVSLVVTLLCRTALITPGDALPVAASSDDAASGAVPMRDLTGRIVALAALAFLIMLAEGTATDWSALHAVEHLGSSETAASLAYGAFAVAMTAGRFAADTVSHRFGPIQVVRYGSIIAAAGMALVVASAWYPLTLLGWVVFGLGLSGIVPQIFTAAGNLGAAKQGAVMARVVGAGYLGLLAGPAIIGWIAEHTGLDLALLVPLLFCAVGIMLAGQVAPSRRRVRSF